MMGELLHMPGGDTGLAREIDQSPTCCSARIGRIAVGGLAFETFIFRGKGWCCAYSEAAPL